MTLMEIVIALGVIAFALPLLLMTAAAAGKHSSHSAFVTRAAWLAKDLHLRLVDERNGLSNSQAVIPFFLGGEAQFIERNAPLVLLLNKDGKVISSIDSSDLSAAIPEREGAYLIAFHAEALPDREQDSPTLVQVFMRIQAPPQATLSKRFQKEFVVLIGSVSPP